MSYCKYCKKEKKELFLHKSLIGKRPYYGKQCVDCRRKKRAERIKNIKKDFLIYKKALKCEKCSFADWRALQFHHKNPLNKDFGLADGVCRGWGIKRVKEEAKKCQCLCANCHQILHFNKREKKV